MTNTAVKVGEWATPTDAAEHVRLGLEYEGKPFQAVNKNADVYKLTPALHWPALSDAAAILGQPGSPEPYEFDHVAIWRVKCQDNERGLRLSAMISLPCRWVDGQVTQELDMWGPGTFVYRDEDDKDEAETCLWLLGKYVTSTAAAGDLTPAFLRCNRGVAIRERTDLPGFPRPASLYKLVEYSARRGGELRVAGYAAIWSEPLATAGTFELLDLGLDDVRVMETDEDGVPAIDVKKSAGHPGRHLALKGAGSHAAALAVLGFRLMERPSPPVTLEQINLRLARIESMIARDPRVAVDGIAETDLDAALWYPDM